jgi:YidC/Oxa1 family membrane protein insertase
MLPHDLFHTVFVYPILNLLVAFFKVFATVGLPGAFGFSIIALTVTIRLILHPFFHQQQRTAKKMQELKPHMDALSKKHKGDAKRLQEEQMRLYKEHGVNPASGCVFLVIQIPVFLGLYNSLNIFLQHGDLNKVIKGINGVLYAPFLHLTSIDPMFFIYNLALSPQKVHGQWWYYAIPVITGILQFLQVKYTTPQMAPAAPKEDGSTDNAADFQKALNMQMKFIFPVMIGYFSYTLPVGLSLYWNVFSIFSIIQYYQIEQKHKKEKELAAEPIKLEPVTEPAITPAKKGKKKKNN